MELLELMARGGHDRMVAVQDRVTGLRAWIALHHVHRGPAYGGIRVWRYRDEDEAVQDVLRLSRSMTFKCVLSGVPGGGAKTVVLADRLVDRPAAMTRLGEQIEQLGGLYRCGPDVGFVDADRVALVKGTRWYAHHGEVLRPAGEATAEGGEWAIRAALEHTTGSAELAGVTVAVQGLGAVGSALARRLIAAGATVVAADPNPAACQRARALGVRLVDPGTIYEQPADVFAPCALGGSLHDLTVQRLRAPIVTGCANNVLARPEHAQMLLEREVTCVPDFVVNAGALIEGAGYEQTGATDFSAEIRRIGDTVRAVLRRADAANCTPTEAATEMAREILERDLPGARLLDRSLG
ncbi:MAG: amino acid dehydrogenase [Planctomycetes bacterium]|nr:amino acid dehydrogenase [Planctomycetota bacterium]